MVGQIDKEWKEASVGYWVWYVTVDLTHDLDLGYFKVIFQNSYMSGIFGLIDVKWKFQVHTRKKSLILAWIALFWTVT